MQLGFVISGVAGQMAQAGPWGPRPTTDPAAQASAPTPAPAPAAVQAPPPPPPPAEHVWHIAENGETKGPFSKASLGRMAGEGNFTRESLVWTPGQDGWMPAEDVPELARLFTILPPPPPPAA